jgi:hypothetical protein
MRSHAIVVVTPRGKHGAGVGERGECRYVQALAQTAVEAHEPGLVSEQELHAMVVSQFEIWRG